MRVLISGFDPIWGIKKTPSGDLAKLWEEGSISVDGVDIRAVVLPQKFAKSTEELCSVIAEFQPHIILMYGATQHNDPVRLERFAVNVERTPMGDNTKIPVKERHIVQGGPAAYESTLPISHLVEKLKEQGVDAKPSYHAGTHVCNSLMYGVLHYLHQHPMPHQAACGFIHVSFPNEYGVIEDEFWSTANFSGIVHSSITLVTEVAKWYEEAHADAKVADE